MTQKEIELLFQDLCARLPYGVKVTFRGYSGREDCTLNSQHLNSTYSIEYLGLKPYLRSLSSMTESERKEFDNLSKFDEDVWMGNHKVGFPKNVRIMSKCVDWLNKNMFDYRGLIPKGLANEAPEEMYNKIKTSKI